MARVSPGCSRQKKNVRLTKCTRIKKLNGLEWAAAEQDGARRTLESMETTRRGSSTKSSSRRRRKLSFASSDTNSRRNTAFGDISARPDKLGSPDCFKSNFSRFPSTPSSSKLHRRQPSALKFSQSSDKRIDSKMVLQTPAMVRWRGV